MDREPAVAGRFYPARARVLAEKVASLLGERPGGLPSAEPARAVIGVLAPHAGYVYSGPVAGATFARVAVPERAVVMCPNHTGRGEPVSLWPEGAWVTPLVRVALDAELTQDLSGCPLVAPDRDAHRFEHALEVQLPFLQRRRPDVSIAALCLAHLRFEECQVLGEALAGAVRRRPALLVASSDMSHYLPARVARAKDERALERFLALDPRGLYEVVQREDISMCGFIPATVMLVASLALGATRAELVRYGHSGEASGDDSAVVGYAGALVY